MVTTSNITFLLLKFSILFAAAYIETMHSVLRWQPASVKNQYQTYDIGILPASPSSLSSAKTT